jgi:hypothetical protein
MRLHLEAQRKPKMNRQARIVTDPPAPWVSHGAVSLKNAAATEAAFWDGRGGVGTPIKIEIRDEANPDKTWIVTVEREISYRVYGLRGGE